MTAEVYHRGGAPPCDLIEPGRVTSGAALFQQFSNRLIEAEGSDSFENADVLFRQDQGAPV